MNRILPLRALVHDVTWRCDMNYVRSKDAHKHIARTSLRALDRKARKLLTIYRSLHPQADVDRLYVKRSQGGRGLISVEDCVNIEVGSLYQYVVNSPESLLMATKDEMSWMKEWRRKV